jgi:hypothetical protein
MENKIVIKSLRRQIDQIVLHEQVENGDAINNHYKKTWFFRRFNLIKMSTFTNMDGHFD